MSPRQVCGLRWARRLEARPGFIPVARPRRADKKAGLRYENAIARVLPEAEHGVWWEFEDRAGLGWCQTDFVLQGQGPAPGRVLVLEAKLTWTWEGHRQLEGLYLPVVQMATAPRAKGLALPVVGVLVARRLTPEAPERASISRSLEEAVQGAASGHRSVLHWIGRGQLAAGRSRAIGTVGEFMEAAHE